MHLTGVSSIGPLYHTAFSIILIGAGLLSSSVRKSWLVVILAFGLFGVLVGAQLVLKISDVAALDLGILYKWYMPVLLFAVYYKWRYWQSKLAEAKMIRVVTVVPILYSALIVVSFLSYAAFSFNPNLFKGASEERFAGFAWGYNTTVNSFFLCAYVNFILVFTPFWKKVCYMVGFVLLLSKTTVIYVGLIAFSWLRPHLKRASFFARAPLFLLATPLLTIALWLGYNQSIRSGNLYGGYTSDGRSDLNRFVDLLSRARLDWWRYVLEDIPSWPAENIILGNGTNIDRRLTSPLWRNMIARYYPGMEVAKTTKTLELDILGHLDLFGVLGAIPFVLIFYVYPFLTIKLPYFKIGSLEEIVGAIGFGQLAK